MIRPTLRACAVGAVRIARTLVIVLCCAPGAARAHAIERVQLEGARRTEVDTITDLLPREPPSSFSEAELDDFARRLDNLAIFDSTLVERRGSVLHVTVREKWTLIPDFAFATGKTASDLFIALGATEYNFLGGASELAVSAYREQRGFGFSVGLAEHEYRHRRWSYESKLAYGSASLRFDDGEAWYNTGAQLSLWVNSVPVLSPYFRYQVGFFYVSERIEDVEGPSAPPSGHGLQLGFGLLYDRYHWHDLVPRGVRVTFNLGPGFFLPTATPRHYSELTVLAALPLARYTVLATRVAGALTARGNANNSYLVGSIEGVRGLDDSLYRNWAQSTISVELRQAVPIVERIALQGVLFADAAAFERMRANGARGKSVLAASVGVGLRVVPTFLATFVARFDLARLLAPDSAWFPQFGVAQYF